MATSVSDKRRFFEREIADQASEKPKYKSERKFSYLQEHEVAQLRKEEERKTQNMSQDEIEKYVKDTVAGSLVDGTDYGNMMTSTSSNDRSPGSKSANGTPTKSINGKRLVLGGSVKTAKAERRRRERLRKEQTMPESCTDCPAPKRTTPAEDRILQAEKRAAWRAARLKSLEDDAMRAQAILARGRQIQKLCGRDRMVHPAATDPDDEDPDECSVTTVAIDIAERVRQLVNGDDDEYSFGSTPESTTPQQEDSPLIGSPVKSNHGSGTPCSPGGSHGSITPCSPGGSHGSDTPCSPGGSPFHEVLAIVSSKGSPVKMNSMFSSPEGSPVKKIDSPSSPEGSLIKQKLPGSPSERSDDSSSEEEAPH